MYIINNEQCKTSLTLVDLNPVELNYYLFKNSCNDKINAMEVVLILPKGLAEFAFQTKQKM